MCPSFRATRDEKDSTRGRANALRLALAGERAGQGPAQPLGVRRARPVPDVQGVQVGVPQQRGHGQAQGGVPAAATTSGRPRPLGHLLMARIHRLNRAGRPAAPLVNWLQERRPVRWLLEKMAGHRPPPQPAAAARATTSAAGSPATRRPPTAGRARPGAAAGRLLHDVQRAGHRPGGRARAGARRLRGRAGRPGLLRPADDQQGLPAPGAAS